jgi:pimeloyl-ACP methyl ester carboxylesterase
MSGTKRAFMDIHGTQLCHADFEGDGPLAVLLHGLGGRGSEWYSTARWLRETRHVIALDQRGHGASAKGLADYTRDAFVNDGISVIERLDLGPALLIGQAMGGLNAFLTATRRPDLVAALIVAEAAPDRNSSAPGNMRNWVESWPLPFPTLADASLLRRRHAVRADVDRDPRRAR